MLVKEGASRQPAPPPPSVTMFDTSVVRRDEKFESSPDAGFGDTVSLANNPAPQDCGDLTRWITP